jgi:Ni,Fe-hydrogenase III large subunit
VLPAELARNLGTLGYVARASGLTVDARADHPQVDLGPGFTPVTQEGGDVLARYAVRASEFAASAALLPRLIGLAVAGEAVGAR